MSINTTDEQMKHSNKIIEQFDSVHTPAKQREIIMTEIEQLISNRENLARIDELERNAYYSQPRKTDPLKLCGIDMDATLVEERITTLRKELDGGNHAK